MMPSVTFKNVVSELKYQHKASPSVDILTKTLTVTLGIMHYLFRCITN